MPRRVSLRPAGFDDLGLRHALADRMLPLLVAAMAFLAALALGGWSGASALARGWEQGAAASVTVQVPRPEEPAAGVPRAQRALAILRDAPAIASAQMLSAADLTRLLRPWLGADPDQLGLPLPAVIAVRLVRPDAPLGPLTDRLQTAVPGTILAAEQAWTQRLSALVRSLQACAALALLVVAAVAAAVVAVATSGGLAARREAIEIVHGLGAADSYIAGRFAARATLLATLGAAVGAGLAIPVLLALARLAAPFHGGEAGADPADLLPIGLWLVLPGLPLAAGLIGWTTAHTTVRAWLRRLP